MEENKNTEEGSKVEGERFEEENIPIAEQNADLQPSTLNLKPSEMEVHHHAHAHGKKTWRSYFWEFLMLFLAVFCGFLAEYYLEHRIEKERGKQFIESFYEDLKADTAKISLNTKFDEEKVQALSNLTDCYAAVSANTSSTSCLLDVIRFTAVNKPFMRTDRTLKQLANAGGYRLLNKEDADSILSYDKDFNNFQDFQSTVFQGAQDNVRTTFNLLVDFKANAQMFKPQDGRLITTYDPADVTRPVLFSADKALLNKYFNDVMLYYRITYNHRRFLVDLKAKQTLLLDYFKSKYHFE